jgi:hypothetical protein
MCEQSKQCTCGLDVNAAQAKCLAAEILCRPHVYMKPDLRKDGNMWSALYGPNIQEGVCGYGETPEKAMEAFDRNWKEQKITNPAQSPSC